MALVILATTYWLHARSCLPYATFVRTIIVFGPFSSPCAHFLPRLFRLPELLSRVASLCVTEFNHKIVEKWLQDVTPVQGWASNWGHPSRKWLVGDRSSNTIKRSKRKQPRYIYFTGDRLTLNWRKKNTEQLKMKPSAFSSHLFPATFFFWIYFCQTHFWQIHLSTSRSWQFSPPSLSLCGPGVNFHLSIILDDSR